MLLAGDERRHNNPDKAYVDADFIRGGSRITATPATLLTDFVSKIDQLKENVTLVYVVSENACYRLKSIANIGTLATGWKKESFDVKITDQDEQLKSTGTPKFAGIDIEGGNPTTLRKKQGSGAASALKVITGTPAGSVGAVLDLAAANPEGTETSYVFYTVTPVTGAPRRHIPLNLPVVPGTLALVGDIPDVSNKVDKVDGKGLSDQNYSLAEKTKLGGIITGISLCFQAPVREYKDYFENAAQITAITLDGASAFQYSMDNGASYNTISLPLGSPINIPAAKFMRWRVTFASNTTLAGVYLKLI